MSAKNENLPLVPIQLMNFLRCGAKGKRTGKPCQQPAMKNGRCRLHGGLSTGAKTPEGKERSRKGNWKDGFYSAEAITERREQRAIMKQLKKMLKALAER